MLALIIVIIFLNFGIFTKCDISNIFLRYNHTIKPFYCPLFCILRVNNHWVFVVEVRICYFTHCHRISVYFVRWSCIASKFPCIHWRAYAVVPRFCLNFCLVSVAEILFSEYCLFQTPKFSSELCTKRLSTRFYKPSRPLSHQNGNRNQRWTIGFEIFSNAYTIASSKGTIDVQIMQKKKMSESNSHILPLEKPFLIGKSYCFPTNVFFLIFQHPDRRWFPKFEYGSFQISFSLVMRNLSYYKTCTSIKTSIVTGIRFILFIYCRFANYTSRLFDD